MYLRVKSKLLIMPNMKKKNKSIIKTKIRKTKNKNVHFSLIKIKKARSVKEKNILNRGMF